MTAIVPADDEVDGNPGSPPDPSESTERPVDDGPGALGSRRPGSRWLAVIVAVAAAAGVLYLVLGRSAPMPDRVAETRALSEAEFVAETGTELLYVGLTAGGGMLDIRYRVIDPDKALVFHDESLPVGLYQPGGVYLERPFHEHSHDVELNRAVVYHELIVNIGSTFSTGDEAILVVGPYRLEKVRIQ